MFYAHERAERDAARAQAAAAEAAADAAADAAAAAVDPISNPSAAPPAQSPPAPLPSPSDQAACASAGDSPLASLFPRPAIPFPAPDLARHARKCAVCAHPDRDAIEGDFVRWAALERIAAQYNLSDRSTLYRHAHATGLFARRKQELGRVLESILEAAETCTLDTADMIIRAARLYTHLDDYGRWFEPPRTHIVVTVPASAVSEPPPPVLPRETPPSTLDPETSNRNTSGLENGQLHENKR